MRVAAVAASLAGAFALTACSGGGDSDDNSASDSPSASATTGAETGGGSGTGGGSAAGGLEGSWLATTDGKAVALVVTGKEAGLFATGGTVCSGTAGEQDGKRTIRLKCTDGSKDRAAGTVDSVDGRQLKVTWEGGLGAETYTKAEGGKLPTGLPTAGLGS
ncbi:hypothetical protein IM697_42325 [Streptomyces ferrugineus]|uniref:Serine/threonine protein kinase n=1 Tax=Streptomyces ferrugineus TaxID=1413221 RepID=A0A7M2T080_9ACTN|nr:hypothetical protein [Streptomyces ferrugineus]QOV41549.1 hypothetical protein IM697_42325 [Streptomyces ferrugineus]